MGEFIAQVRKYGFRKRVIALDIGFEAQDKLVYLWRDADHFAELPDVRPSDRLTRVVVEMLCEQLGIPGEDFGVGN